MGRWDGGGGWWSLAMTIIGWGWGGRWRGQQICRVASTLYHISMSKGFVTLFTLHMGPSTSGNASSRFVSTLPPYEQECPIQNMIS
jgi:hypothetical protein